MFISLDWLKDYVDISKSITPKELGLKLTMHTVEIDEVINQANQFDKVVVGKVLEVKKHPGADRLNLAKVDVGPSAGSGRAEKEPLDIVCGAPNLEKGQFVSVAMVGAVLPGDFKIEEREVRGEKSRGMICSEDELGLGDDHEGIMVLNKKAKAGQAFGEYLKLNDILFDVDNKSITNRPDLWGHLGMAREVAVFLGSKNTKKFKNILDSKLENNQSLPKLNVRVEDKELCPRYMAVQIDGVEVKESSEKTQKRLTAVGMRPINNIVDATNYVMLELGQPMHAFDASQVSEIVIRRAKKNETIKTLDDEERKLDTEMLVIADSKNPLAIAGVMGGENSEINDETTSVILESANFDPVSVRKTAAKTNLRTEASTRFEKSLDPNMCSIALARFLEIIKETCPKASIGSQIVDESNFNLDQGPIEVDLDWLNKRIGEDFSKEKSMEILKKLGFTIEESVSAQGSPLRQDFEGQAEGTKKNILKVGVPTWRATKDISIREDLLEEVARIHGYDNLTSKMPLVAIDAPEENRERKLERKIKEILAFGGKMNEVYSYSFVGEEKLKKLKISPENYINLANPISNIHTMLRQNLFVNLLDSIKINQAKFDSISLFEIGNIFLEVSGRINKSKEKGENLPYQEKHIALIEAGDNAYEEVKSKFEYLLSNFFLDTKYETVEQIPDWSDKSSFAKIKIGDQDVGFVSKINKTVLASLGIKKEVAVAEVGFEKIFNLITSAPQKLYEEGSKFPPVIRDLAFVVPSKVLYNDIKAEIEGFDELIADVELFDVYQGKNLEKTKRNLAFHVVYLSDSRTLKSEEIDEMQKKLIADLEKKFDAKIRDF